MPVELRLAAGIVEMSHEDLDALPGGKSVEYLRALLVLNEAGAAVTKAIAALEAPQHVMSFDLNADDDIYFVLTTALEEFAARTRHDATDENLDASKHLRWARVAETALESIEAAL